MLVHAVVVHVCQNHVAVGALTGSLAEVGQILLQNAARAGWSQDDQVRSILFVLASDVLHHFLLRAPGKNMPVHNAGRHRRKVARSLEHAAHDVEVVIPQGCMHDSVDIPEGRSDSQGADVGRPSVHPVGELHAHGGSIASLRAVRVLLSDRGWQRSGCLTCDEGAASSDGRARVDRRSQRARRSCTKGLASRRGAAAAATLGPAAHSGRRRSGREGQGCA
mmetsp:Transcript_39216/g.63357  ORF Transcript_39216/g.63357 Transcript_39216/m.63357 type:complete len:221 (-) Transcript_39216:204-866(-)